MFTFLVAMLFVLPYPAQGDNSADLPVGVMNFTGPSVPPDTPASLAIPETLTVIAVNENGQPVEGAKARLQSEFAQNLHQRLETGSADQKKETLPDAVTDAQGRAMIDLRSLQDKAVAAIHIDVQSEPLSCRNASFTCHYAEDQVVVPSELTVTLKKGKKLSGRVVDEDGKPIAGVCVQVWLRTFGMAYYLETDSGGCWETPAVPQGGFIQYITLSHENFRTLRLNFDFNFSNIVMKRMPVLEGTVRDEKGMPVDGATVTIGTETAKTDADGRYRFQREKINLSLPFLLSNPSHVMGIEVTAPGKADHFQYPSPTPKTIASPRDFTLEPAQTVRIHVVDENGRPFKDFEVFGILQTDATDEAVQHPPRKLPGEISNDAVWVWKNAPSIPMEYEIRWKQPEDKLLPQPKHYKTEQTSYVLAADKSDHVVTMYAYDRVFPKQRDKIIVPETMELRLIDPDGEPVAGAKIDVTLSCDSFQFVSFSTKKRAVALSDEAGKCVIGFAGLERRAINGFSLQINAGDDFLPVQAMWSTDYSVSRGMFPKDPTNQLPEQWELHMERYHNIFGIVTDEDGNPLEGASTGMATRCYIMFDQSLSSSIAYQFGSPLTDKDGRWEAKRYYHRKEGAFSGAYFSAPGFERKRVEIDPAKSEYSVTLQPMAPKKLVTFRIWDEDGFPVTEAQFNLRGGQSAFPKETEPGRYVIDPSEQSPPQTSGLVYYTVETFNRHTPQQVRVDLSADPIGEIELVMKRGKPLKIRLLDAAGQPLPNANLSYATIAWPSGQQSNVSLSSHTFDKNGFHYWNNAPDLEAEYNISWYDGESHSMKVKMRPREEEYRVTAVPGGERPRPKMEQKKFAFNYHATDAETGEPIKAYELINGSFQQQTREADRGGVSFNEPVSIFSPWFTTIVNYSQNGVCESTIDRYFGENNDDTADHVFVIRADGYRLFKGVIPVKSDSPQQVEIDIKLERLNKDQETVTDPNELWEEKEFVAVASSS